MEVMTDIALEPVAAVDHRIHFESRPNAALAARAAGVPVLRAVGAKDGEMLLALKSGNFGGPEFFSDALKLMR